MRLPPGIVIAAPRSGAGKTTVTLGLLRSLARRGTVVQAFKCGPDYIDPAFHQAAAGRPSFNIDSWAMRKSAAVGLLAAGCSGAELAVAEALMGLFDGVAGAGAWGNGSSADLAALTGWPVVLVLDVSGQSQTAAAVARGFCGFREGVAIAGVIVNRAGSERHAKLVLAALEQEGLSVLGTVPRRSEIALPERHLGLVQAEETAALASRLDTLADLIDAHVDVDRLSAAARTGCVTGGLTLALRPPGQRIALARDAAFSFVYPHLLAAWRAAGAEIVPFSPLADEPPDAAADIVWLPGGYPELHAERLSVNRQFAAGVRTFAESKPVHGECGGYMVLGTSLEDGGGRRHAMLGLLGLESSLAKPRLHLGYRRARLLGDCPIGSKGETVCGHEFHYAAVLASPDAAFAEIDDAEGRTVAESGSRRGLVTGSFFHMIDKSEPVPELK